MIEIPQFKMKKLIIVLLPLLLVSLPGFSQIEVKETSALKIDEEISSSFLQKEENPHP